MLDIKVDGQVIPSMNPSPRGVGIEVCFRVSEGQNKARQKDEFYFLPSLIAA